jgi:hypothetical protein
MDNYMNTGLIKVSLLFFFIIALIGAALRAAILFPFPFNYAYLVHAHSHTAFQGWIYTTMMIFLTRMFLSEEQIHKGRYALQFKLTAVVILGVLISFSLQGYGLYSIIFSTLFQILNYWFIFRFLKDVRNSGTASENKLSLRFVKTGLWLGLLSTLMPWFIGILAAKGQSGSEAYNSFVYTFLHFQYNGWFLFVVLGLFFRWLEIDNIAFSRKHAERFYLLFTISVVPALSLSLLGMSYAGYIAIPAYIAATLQLLGAEFFLLILLKDLKLWFNNLNGWVKIYCSVFLISFFLKILLQFLSAFPLFQQFAFQSRNIVLGYLHLSMIGVISFFLLAFLFRLGWLSSGRTSSYGNALLLFGFIASELALVLSGAGLISSYEMLLAGSAAMAVGTLLLLVSPRQKESAG